MNFSWSMGKRFCILGLARSGLAVARALHKQKIPVLVWDDKISDEARAVLKQENIILENLLAHDWQKNDVLVISPGIPHTLPKPHPIIAKAKEAGVPITVDVELFLKSLPKEVWVIGVTGSNGKSTTVSLIHHLLKTAGLSSALGGNFGVPVFALNPADIYVLELSSYQLELIETPRLNMAVLLNITSNHLERHGTIENYTQAKRKIFDLVVPGGVKILGVDTPLSAALYQEEMVKISIKTPLDQMPITVDNAPFLKGEHNLENALTASVVFLNTPHGDRGVLQKGIDTFPGLVHRQQQIGKTANVIFINDSKATSCESAIKALECHDNIYWIVGGKLKENDFSLGKFLPYLDKIKAIFTIGEGGPVFQDAFQEVIPTFSCGTLDIATKKAYDMAKESKEQAVVLLSPATASFDQFKDFEDRGESFGCIVHQILTQEPL